MSLQLKQQHLYWRFGFGPELKSQSVWSAIPAREWWPALKKDALEQAPEYMDLAENALKGLLMGVEDAGKMERRDLSQEERQQLRRQSREDLQSLNLRWLDEMVNGKAQLREKVAFFWHGHFASRNINILYQQQLLHIIRTHALGNFRDLLRQVSKSAAMLAFLNNQQNKKKRPNENFAREVMELFTLGRGHYTEQDVKEAARAFTGWGFRLDGEFAFRAWDHDKGPKTIFGKTGDFDGDDALDLLLEKRQAAYFIASKMYRFFVNETKEPPPERIRALGDRFFDSGYEIMALLDAIANSAWFYDAENIGTKIKSPIELWVGIRRALPFEMERPENQILLQKALGQILFYPPNVAGWPGGRNWIDGVSLMLRMRIPQMIAGGRDWDVNAKDDDDQQMGRGGAKRGRQRFLSAIDWSAAERRFESLPKSELPSNVARYLWQTPLSEAAAAALTRHIRNDDAPDLYARACIIQLMATPEYQLC